MAALCADKRVLYITSSPEKAQKAAADIESYTGQRCVYIGAQEQQLGASSQSHEQTHAVISALREVQNGAWAAADAARDRLNEMGIVLEDGPQGTTWRRK